MRRRADGHASVDPTVSTRRWNREKSYAVETGLGSVGTYHSENNAQRKLADWS